MQELERALCALLAAQERQRRDLAAGRLDDLWRWRGEMEQVLRRVQRCLATIDASRSLEDEARRRRVLDLFLQAARGAQDLSRRAAQTRTGLQARLAGLRRGRRCLRRYRGQPTAGAPPPRHLHATT